jgi:hypothetical protein
MEPSIVASTLLSLSQRFPGLFTILALAVPVVCFLSWQFLLVSFRQRGHRYRLDIDGRVHRGFDPTSGTFARLRPLLSRLGSRGWVIPAPLLPWLRPLSRLLRRIHNRLIFGLGEDLSLLLFFLTIAYTIALALALVHAHWAEFSLLLEARGYLHWDWTVPQLGSRSDLEYRWWLKWFWRQSTLGQGYFRGLVRLGRGGPGPRRHLKWKRPPRNLGYWLGVWRYRTPIRPFRDRAVRSRIFIGRRHPFRLLRWLLGLVLGSLFLQGWAVLSVFYDLPDHINRTVRRGVPRIGTSTGRNYAAEVERFRDSVRRANWVGSGLLLVTLLAAFGWPPVPVLGLSPRFYFPTQR